MVIKLPVMNHLVQRWNLPPCLIEQCDFYKVERIGKEELHNLLDSYTEHRNIVEICQHGIIFNVIFQNDASCFRHSHYWLSYRSMTFEFQGSVTTKSYVLVQPDKAMKASAKRSEPVPKPSPEQKLARHGNNYKEGTAGFRTFAELSQPKESNDD